MARRLQAALEYALQCPAADDAARRAALAAELREVADAWRRSTGRSDATRGGSVTTTG